MIGNRLISGYKGLVVALGVVIVLIGAGFVIFNDSIDKNPGSSSSDASSSATKSNKLTIKDLGIVITLPDELMGTTAMKAEVEVSGTSKYTLPPIVNLQLDSYESLVNKCLGNGVKTNSPYASLTKISGQAPEGDKQLLKQFSTFYIDRLAAGVNVTCKDRADQTKLDDITKSLNDSLKNTFSNAQQI